MCPFLGVFKNYVIFLSVNQYKFCIATGGPVFAGGEHVTGGLVAARSLAAACGLLAAYGWVGGPRGRLYQLFTHCFLTLHQVSSLHQVSAKCTHAHDVRFLTLGDLVKIFHFSNPLATRGCCQPPRCRLLVRRL